MTPALARDPTPLEVAEHRIRELELALEHCVYALPSEAVIVGRALGLSWSQAMLALALARAPHGLSHSDLDQVLPVTNRRRTRDPEFRTLGTIKAQLAQIRARQPGLLVPRRGGGSGVFITEEGRARVLSLVPRQGTSTRIDASLAVPYVRLVTAAPAATALGTTLHFRVWVRGKTRIHCAPGRSGRTTIHAGEVTCPACKRLIGVEG